MCTASKFYSKCLGVHKSLQVFLDQGNRSSPPLTWSIKASQVILVGNGFGKEIDGDDIKQKTKSYQK